MHWRNSNFQLRHFLAGKCHTADGAYRMLRELLEERELALENARPKSWRWLFTPPRRRRQIQDLIDACVAEIRAIESLLAEVQPLRKYAHLPDPEAHQASQADEWRLEFLWRAENFLLTGGIPANELEAMRLHPAWSSDIWPHIQTVKRCIQQNLPYPTVERLCLPSASTVRLTSPSSPPAALPPT